MKYKDAESLKKNRDFQLVYKTGTSYVNKYLVMYAKENQLEKNRIGISVSKKVGNSVVRHRLCRLVRESYRLHEDVFRRGFDIVVVARVSAKERTFREIESAFLHLGRLHHLVEKEEPESNIDSRNQILPEIYFPFKEYQVSLFSVLFAVRTGGN